MLYKFFIKRLFIFVQNKVRTHAAFPLFSIIGFICVLHFATHFSKRDHKAAQAGRQHEDVRRKMLNDTTAPLRFFADSIFTKTLVRALKTPNSFYYPFDSLITVSHMYAPDSSFRIFSWQFTRYNDMWIDKDYYWQRGAIQMRTADGSLKLYPLHDVSSYTTAPQDSIRTAKTG